MACSTHKYEYMSRDLAETALIDQHIFKGFDSHQGPQNVYECDMCGSWHLTSKSDTRNDRLQSMMDSGILAKKQEASRWERNF